jgi:4-diphosphocytidyl-2C-methyl-D-erythritol kinase
LSAPVLLADHAPAKVNLTLRVLGRRADGYHELESLVVFAAFGNRLSFSVRARAGTQPNCVFRMAIKVRAFLHRYFIPGGQK